MLQRMQAMARIQARACAKRAYTSDSPNYIRNSSHSHHPVSTATAHFLLSQIKSCFLVYNDSQYVLSFAIN